MVRAMRNAAHGDRERVRTANNRARDNDLPGDLAYEEWLEIVARYGDRCAYCFGPWSELEHVISVIHPDCPGTTRANVVPARKSCNSRKTSRTLVPHIASAFWPPNEHLLDMRQSHEILTERRQTKQVRERARYQARKLAVA